jgi:hypothetical protein
MMTNTSTMTAMTYKVSDLPFLGLTNFDEEAVLFDSSFFFIGNKALLEVVKMNKN